MGKYQAASLGHQHLKAGLVRHHAPTTVCLCIDPKTRCQIPSLGTPPLQPELMAWHQYWLQQQPILMAWIQWPVF